MSEHNHDCGCGHDDCNCGEENLTVTLTLDNDEVLECAVLTIFSAGDRQYIALLPLEDAEDTEEGDVFIYRCEEDENGEVEIQAYSFTENEDGTEGDLQPIPEDSDAEWDMIEEVFNSFMEE